MISWLEPILNAHPIMAGFAGIGAGCVLVIAFYICLDFWDSRR